MVGIDYETPEAVAAAVDELETQEAQRVARHTVTLTSAKAIPMKTIADVKRITVPATVHTVEGVRIVRPEIPADHRRDE